MSSSPLTRSLVIARLRHRKLVCPECDYSTRVRYDTRPEPSSWRHLDLAGRRLIVKAELRWLSCPHHGERVEAVPFARHGSRFTRDFECLVEATKMDKTAVHRLVRIDWDTVGRICERVVADELDPGRLDRLFGGVDEVSWKKHHNYLTLVVNHQTDKVVWGAEGKDARGVVAPGGSAGGGVSRASAVRRRVPRVPARAGA